MGFLLLLLIATAGANLPGDVRYPDTTEVFRCTFDDSADPDYDGWPDGWTRQQGPGYPHYVRIKISDELSPPDGRALSFAMDGGAAAVYSAPIPIRPMFGYVLECYVKTDGLKYDRAYGSIAILDHARQRQETVCSESVYHSSGWTKIRLGPISPRQENARFAIIGLHVVPTTREDLKGTAAFADVWLGRVPRLTLRTGHAYNFFVAPSSVEVSCTASGFVDLQPRVTLYLEDALGHELARQECPLVVEPVDAAAQTLPKAPPPEVEERIGRATWKLPLAGTGFYRVRATMKGPRETVCGQHLDLVLVEPQHSPPGGEFGWTLPHGQQPVPPPMLNQLVAQAGINWVKYPVWFDEKQRGDLVDRLIYLNEWLTAQDIELIGLLHEPPPSLISAYGDSPPRTIAGVFAAEPNVWAPSLEPVMARLATRVRWWQLGDDHDTSFVGYPELAAKIGQVKAQMDRIGQDVNLAIGWSWLRQWPQAPENKKPWRALSLSANPSLTAEELGFFLDGCQANGAQRWVVLQPLSRNHYSLEVRATDLVHRMIAAKAHRAEAIFCPQPFSTMEGLMNDDGTPGELFLPWRTTALMLSGAQYVGRVQMPAGSRCEVFSRGTDALMAVWNDRPVQEILYLGDRVERVDLWGHRNRPLKRDDCQVIDVGPLPVFVTGLSEPVASWRMNLAFARLKIPSVFGQPHANSLRIKNSFPHEIEGRAALVIPHVWMVQPQQFKFHLGAGESRDLPLSITLPYDATSGKQQIRVDFDIQAERRYQFSAYQTMDVGLGDVDLEIVTRLNEHNELEVQQRLINETNRPVNFRCQLFVPDRVRLKTQVIDLDRGQDVKVYRLPDGQELLGKILCLRAEEMDGPRTLNYSFSAEP